MPNRSAAGDDITHLPAPVRFTDPFVAASLGEWQSALSCLIHSVVLIDASTGQPILPRELTDCIASYLYPLFHEILACPNWMNGLNAFPPRENARAFGWSLNTPFWSEYADSDYSLDTPQPARFRQRLMRQVTSHRKHQFREAMDFRGVDLVCALLWTELWSDERHAPVRIRCLQRDVQVPAGGQDGHTIYEQKIWISAPGGGGSGEDGPMLHVWYRHVYQYPASFYSEPKREEQIRIADAFEAEVHRHFETEFDPPPHS